MKAPLFALAAVSLIGGAALAHHSSTAAYDLTKTVTYKGTLHEARWINPHVDLDVMIAGPDGKPVEMIVETHPPATLEREGLTKDRFKAGDKVTIVGNPARDGGATMTLISITGEDGKTFTTTPSN